MGYDDPELASGMGYRMANKGKPGRSGMSFTIFYAGQATCTASRAGILTRVNTETNYIKII